jgi:hypothetical protein
MKGQYLVTKDEKGGKRNNNRCNSRLRRTEEDRSCKSGGTGKNSWAPDHATVE